MRVKSPLSSGFELVGWPFPRKYVAYFLERLYSRLLHRGVERWDQGRSNAAVAYWVVKDVVEWLLERVV